VTKITDIVGGEDVYDLVAGVEAEAGGDVAYIVFQKEWTTSSQFIYRAVPVAIPDKHLQGGETRIFHYENKITGESHPVCIVYNRLDPQNLQANVFSIYMIDSSDPLTPQLAQTFVPEYVNDRGPYYFDKPELIGDFDNDGASDIVMAAMQYTPDWTYDPILGFKGIGSETGVSRWRLFE
ncbi:MAG: hypothetical protein JXR73_19105, partial [Candidatus Omnitrophica bacterium]|nr:hypothetical protein [Candidatus Omnitrophota bacterium]